MNIEKVITALRIIKAFTPLRRRILQFKGILKNDVNGFCRILEINKMMYRSCMSRPSGSCGFISAVYSGRKEV